MKKGFFSVLGFLGLALLVATCNKPVYKYNSDFEGIWRTPVIYDSILNKNILKEIVIDGDEGSFKNTCEPCGTDLCNCVSTQYGKAVMNADKTQMRIGSSSSYVLTIQEEPNIDSTGLWTMKIQGSRYYRQ